MHTAFKLTKNATYIIDHGDILIELANCATPAVGVRIELDRYDEAIAGAALARAALEAVAYCHQGAGVSDEPSTRDDARAMLQATIGYATELVRQLDEADRDELDPAPRDAGEIAAELAVLADDDRDALSATVERLYDGIDAALGVLDGDLALAADDETGRMEHAYRILRDLRPSVTA